MISAAAGALVAVATAQPLDPYAIPQFQSPLIIPPAMPRVGEIIGLGGLPTDYYEIAVRQFTQQILPPGFPNTTVWGYGSALHAGTFNYPSFTIETQSGKPVRIRWINGLVDQNGRFLKHLLTVDPTLHWANPPGGPAGRDSRPSFAITPPPYQGPVPFVTHVHGAHTYDDSDGFTEAWYLPDAKNIPAGYSRVGSKYERFRAQAEARSGQAWTRGSAVFDYLNDQAASTLWYHDHTLGMTRLNVYAGPAGFYMVRGGAYDLLDGSLPGPAPQLGDPAGVKYREIPLAMQDRSFNADGSLHYPESRSEFDGITGPFLPETDLSPFWNPEVFGNTMLVNGRTWPYLEVEPKRYRFRLLNGCNSRFLILRMSYPGIPFWQIGAEGGFLRKPVSLGMLLMAPAERADVIVDFSGHPVGSEIILQNLGPDEPFSGGIPGLDFPMANPATTGRVMKFKVVASTGDDTTALPKDLNLPKPKALPPVIKSRKLALMEMMSMDFDDAPSAAMLGVMVNGVPQQKEWDDEVSENPLLGMTERWEIFNFTADAHPIHIHQVQFEVASRQNLALDGDDVQIPVSLVGNPVPPNSNESGFKDTVIAYPGQVTRLRVRFDIPGLFVWHCHIVEHEDNEMMRPLKVRKLTN